MGMDAVCPQCGHAERSGNRRGATIGSCPQCATQMRAHTAGKAKGRYICPIAGCVVTLGLGYTVQLTEPKRLAFVPGWEDDRREPDPDRPGWLRPVRYHRTEPDRTEQDQLDRAAGRVFGPGCVTGHPFAPHGPGSRYHGKAGVFLLPVPDADPAAWFVNEPVSYRKCAACPARVIASDRTQMDTQWTARARTYMSGRGPLRREVANNPGPHTPGSYACRDCRPSAAGPSPAHQDAAETAPAAARRDGRTAGDDADGTGKLQWHRWGTGHYAETRHGPGDALDRTYWINPAPGVGWEVSFHNDLTDDDDLNPFERPEVRPTLQDAKGLADARHAYRSRKLAERAREASGEDQNEQPQPEIRRTSAGQRVRYAETAEGAGPGGAPSEAAPAGDDDGNPPGPQAGQAPGASAQQRADDDTVAGLHEAIGAVSAVCDYARKDDGRGFNAADAWLGHVLAAMPAAAWTADEALAAWDMLRKYRGQLQAAGISYDRLPRPAGGGELEDARREEARERARERAAQWREQQYRQARTYVRCDAVGGDVTFAFPYDPGLVTACRRIDGRRYDPASKANVFPFTSIPQVIELAAAQGIQVAAEVRALAATATARATEAADRPQIRLDERDGTIIIDTAFNPDLNQALRQLNADQPTWDRTARVHRLSPHTALQLPDLAGTFPLRISDQAQAAIDAAADRQEQNRATATALQAEAMPVPGLTGGMALKPQQYPVVRFARQHRRILIGDDMGWGKTASSLAAVAADGAYPAVVVCRPSLTLNWVAEIRRFFPALAVHQASGTTPQPIPVGTDVVVIGSAALAAKPGKTPDGGKEFGWVRALTETAPKALIIDEGQDTKEHAANRSQACQQLAESVTGRDGMVLDLTGTAILNRPRELCQQLTILGRIGEFGGPKAFLWRYCLAETNEWGASYNGARNLIELHDRLLAWGIMIRRSDDAALGLPPCREHVLRIPPAELDPEVMARYRQAEADLLRFLADRARETAARLGTDPEHAAVQAAVRASAAEHLVAINTLRQLAGRAKRDYVTRWTRERVTAGEKVMIAAHHRGEVDAYAAQFGGLKLQGGQPVAEKEAVKAAFQQQPAAEAPVIAVAIGAGGVGHTLTAAAIGIQAEQAWTPGDTQQMKKRLHRIGQDRPVDYYITVAEHTIDEQLWDVVTAKQATLNAVLDGKSDDAVAADENCVAAELTWRLTQQGLTGNSAPRPGPAQHDEAAQRPGPTGNGSAAPAAPAERQLSTTPPATATGHAANQTDADRAGPAQPPAGQASRVRSPAPGSQDDDAPGTGQDAGNHLAREQQAGKAAATVNTRWAGSCALCHAAPPGPGGILCPPCRAAIEQRNRARSWHQPGPADSNRNSDDDLDGDPGRGLRQTAHHYLSHGLLPVPAWATRQNGECCCPRGADCPRPGKHPRSVHTGPGPRDYSWKPLACHTHDDVDRRFADDGEYAAANLMLAIPAGMMVIDQDNDDGGHQAVTELAARLGELPPTLSHRTPHGEHHIYRTPPGWKGRAWVGKDTRNPLPPGIDLRMPGQILMAPPSRVPGPDGRLEYGPPSGETAADLPAAYLAAWTPPEPAARPAARPVLVPPDAADRAASYVHKTISGVLADLAGHKPGGRNTAIYTAALKVGSVLGAARSTPGAELAAAGWTDEAAEDALMSAAVQNGYVDTHGTAMGRSAIRSGLRNGLRNPRALPDFAANAHADQASAVSAAPGTTAPAGGTPKPAGRHPDPASQPSHAAATTSTTAIELRRVGEVTRVISSGQIIGRIYRDQSPRGTFYRAETASGPHPTANDCEVGRRLASIDHAASAIIAATNAAPRPPGDSTPVNREHDNRRKANLVAVAADEAYRAGNLDQAQQHLDQAAALDPSRAGLWQQHRTEIAAKQLFLRASQAQAGGDPTRAQELIQDARQLDPRMQALWHRHLSGLRAGKGAPGTPEHAMQGHQAAAGQPQPASPARNTRRDSSPRWPDRPAMDSSPKTREPAQIAPRAALDDPLPAGSPTPTLPVLLADREPGQQPAPHTDERKELAGRAPGPNPDTDTRRVRADAVSPGMVVWNPYGGSRGRAVVASEAREKPDGTVQFDTEDGRTGHYRPQFELDYDRKATERLNGERAAERKVRQTVQPQHSRAAVTSVHPERQPSRQQVPSREGGRKNPAAGVTAPDPDRDTARPSPVIRDRRSPGRQADARDWRDTLISNERKAWQPSPIQPDSPFAGAPEAKGPEIDS